MKFLFLSLSLFFICSCFSQDSLKVDQKLILGKWVSVDDPKFVVLITKSKYIEYYDVGSQAFTYKIDQAKLIKRRNDDVYEYDIVSLSKTNLTLLYVTRGNLLTFRRAK